MIQPRPSLSFLREAIVSSSAMGRNVHSLTLSARNLPELYEFPSFDGCQKRFLSGPTRKVDLAPHPVVGLVLQLGDTEKLPQALGLESLGPLLRVSKQGPFLAVEVNGVDKNRKYTMIDSVMSDLGFLLAGIVSQVPSTLWIFREASRS